MNIQVIKNVVQEIEKIAEAKAAILVIDAEVFDRDMSRERAANYRELESAKRRLEHLLDQS